ncbi:MAG: nicotinate (nicotinamide) nucleotide adenylyltransferase [Treponema sp.]|nr:nicotinate (nicotinamide) nucleotide adenylyltransferase [Treponema sp.]
MKLGILGGSFNPVHLGHLFLADNVLSALKLDRVVFIPAYRSPFKLDDIITVTANDRVDMLCAAIAADARYAVDNCEVRREGVSYTVNTIEDILLRYNPSEKPVLIIGDDVAPDFPKWRESDKILQLAQIAVAHRINSSAVKYPFPCIRIDNKVMDISSQDIRQKIKDGSSWRSLVPPEVCAVIEDRQLYGYNHEQSNDFSQVQIQRIEAAARDALNTERFLHSRNTAIAAYDLCLNYGLNPMTGYLAGIAHDLAKQLDGKQILKILKSKNNIFKISALENEKPNLLHGKAAAVLLREHFCIHNKDVLEAVAFHTLGSENMGLLAKIIYVADKTEISRNIDPALRKMSLMGSKESDLDSILYAVLEKTIVKLKSKELDLSKDTLMLLEKIKQK